MSAMDKSGGGSDKPESLDTSLGVAVERILRAIDSAGAAKSQGLLQPREQVNSAIAPKASIVRLQLQEHRLGHLLQMRTRSQCCDSTIMNLSHITRTVLSVQVVLNDLPGGFIVACHALAKSSDERIERKGFGIAVDGIDQVHGVDNVDLDIDGVQSEDGERTSLSVTTM